MLAWLIRSSKPNPQLPQDALWDIKQARDAGRDAIYHGACHGCVWQAGNAVGAGIRWCSECKMFSDRNFSDPFLPDRSQTMPYKEPDEWHYR